MAMAMPLHFLYLALTIFLLTGNHPSPASSRSLQDVPVHERHAKWMSEYGRVYKDAEERERRFGIFKANLARIETFNGASNEPPPYKLGLNQFADLTNQEFKASLRRSDKLHGVLGRDSDSAEHGRVAVPAAVDWRKKGAVTPIKSSTCGSWAISAVEAVEGIHDIKTGELVSLSEQQLIDCYTKGCEGDGGSVDGAFMYIIGNRGVTTESNYPSTGANGTCDAKKESDHAAKISGYQDVPPNDEEALTAAVAGQPVSVGIDASDFAFQFYANGVLTGDCGTDVDHDVTIVGYGASNGVKYWLVKNSWGTGWGEKGYIRLERDVKSKGGMCGIAIEASYPTTV